MKQKFNLLFAAVMILSLVLSACGSATPTAETNVPPQPESNPTATTAPAPTQAPVDSGIMLPEVDPAAFSGDVTVAGSSTVYPLAEAMAERFEDEGFGGNITIASVGSGAGFERFCTTGETDIANASRGIKDSEIENCAAIGRTPIEFRVGTDALAIVVSTENDFVTDVTLEELALIFSIHHHQMVGCAPRMAERRHPALQPRHRLGTFDFFVEVVMAPLHLNDEGKADLEAGEKAILDAANIQFSEDDNVLVQGVEGSKYAIGYFGFAYYVENQGSLKAASSRTAWHPTAETAENGEYPLARPLFIYSDATILNEKPQVAAFINFFLTFVNEEIDAVGYFPASQAALDAAKQALFDALKYIIFSSPLRRGAQTLSASPPTA